MAVSLGELSVQLTAQTREFKSRLDSAEARLDKFENEAERSTRKTGSSFKKLGKAVGGVTVAITALAGVIATVGIARLVRGSLEAAGSFESLRVRLQVFLGTQEKANDAFARFTEIAAKTPFTLEGVIAAAATLAVVTGDDVDALEKLVFQAANVAATAGIDIPEAASNMSRALTTGLASAELLRDRGITGLIQKMTGVPDATKLSVGALGGLARAFDFVFGATGRYGDAAAALSDTLEGKFSNIGDAAMRMRAALGEALAPSVIDAASTIIIPFFTSLREVIEANSDRMKGYAEQVIPKALESFRNLVRIGSGLVRGLGFLIDAWDGLRVAIAFVQAFLVGIVELIRTVVLAFIQLARAILNAGKALFFVSVGEFGKAKEAANGIVDAWDEMKESVRLSNEAMEASQAVVRELATEVATSTKFTDGLADGMDSLANVASQVANNMGKAGEAIEKAGNQAAEAAPKFESVPLPGITSSGKIRAGGEAAGRGVATLTESFDLFEAESNRRKIESILKGLDDPATQEATESFGEQMGDALETGIGDALKAIASGDMESFAQSLASTSEAFFDLAMERVLGNMEEGIGKLFDDLEAKIPGLGTAVAGAFAIGLGLLAGALRKTTANVTDAAIESAVTSTQAVRGVVAGPTQIAIGEVATGIEEAFQPSLRLDETRNRLLNDLIATARSGAGSEVYTGAVGTESELGETSASLA